MKDSATAADPGGATSGVVKAGLPLKTLLWVDQQCATTPGALPDCLGDAYLCRFNPVFAGVRKASIAAGVTYREQPNLLGRTYSIAPLFALEQILSSGEVPYRGDVESLSQLIASRPDFKPDLREMRGFFAGHRMLHESAHVLADRTLRQQSWALQERHAGAADALRSLLGEALANTVESVGGAYAANGTHRLLWEWNSYIHFQDPSFGLLRSCLDAFGPRALFELAFWVLFHLNVRAETNAPGEGYLSFCRSVVFDHLPLSAAQRQVAVSIGPVMFGLSSGFRAGTTPTYFRMLGGEDGYKQAKAVDLNSAKELEAIGLPAAVRLFSTMFCEWVGVAGPPATESAVVPVEAPAVCA